MRIRYRTLDVPPGDAAAFTPTPTTNPVASSWGLVDVTGSPGTLPIPSPAPQRHYLPALTARGGVDSAQGSMVTPDYITPDLYRAGVRAMGPAEDAGIGMRMRRRNPIPVPSLSYPRIGAIAMSAPRIGGRRTMPWPRAFQRYPSAACPPADERRG